MSHEGQIVSFQRENVDSVLAEALPLFYEHWKEVARNRDLFQLDPDPDYYRGAEKAGIIRVYTVRDALCGGTLVGYATYLVNKHPHYKSVKWAVSDIFWLKPSLRTSKRPLWYRLYRRARYWLFPSLLKTSIGIRFFDFIEMQLAAEGVNVMHSTYKVEHPAPGRVLRYLGHKHIENGYAKVLQGVR